jgi:hypothetical protein
MLRLFNLTVTFNSLPKKKNENHFLFLETNNLPPEKKKDISGDKLQLNIA